MAEISMKVSLLFGALGLLACLIVPVAGQAQASDTTVNATKALWFAQIDSDGDGVISGGELDAMRTWRFLQVDLNTDRLLTIQEFMQDLSNNDEVLSKRRRDRFAMMDDDQDGLVTLQEYIDFGVLVMVLLDRDGDRLIELAEFEHGVRYPL
ncbi:MAG: hypothetical protein WD711_02600 [Dongiaceae bacterium]